MFSYSLFLFFFSSIMKAFKVIIFLWDTKKSFNSVLCILALSILESLILIFISFWSKGYFGGCFSSFFNLPSKIHSFSYTLFFYAFWQVPLTITIMQIQNSSSHYPVSPGNSLVLPLCSQDSSTLPLACINSSFTFVAE